MYVPTPNFWRPLHALRFEDLDDLRESSTPESVRLDFKRWEFLQDPEKLRKHLCAMANGNTSGGRFIFGAKTDPSDQFIMEFEGKEAKALRREVARLRSSVFEVDPPVRLELQYVPHPDGGDVVVAEVRPAEDGPHQVKGCYHIRKTDGIGQMTHQMVMAAAQRYRSGANDAGLPGDLFTKDHFQDRNAVLAGVALTPPWSCPY